MCFDIIAWQTLGFKNTESTIHISLLNLQLKHNKQKNMHNNKIIKHLT